MVEKVVITRHASLVELLRERGIIWWGDVRIIPHATPDDVRGQHVVGVLPLSLAALAVTVTEIPLALAPEDQGRELDIERLRQVAQPARTYVVRDITPEAE